MLGIREIRTPWGSTPLTPSELVLPSLCHITARTGNDGGVARSWSRPAGALARSPHHPRPRPASPRATGQQGSTCVVRSWPRSPFRKVVSVMAVLGVLPDEIITEEPSQLWCQAAVFLHLPSPGLSTFPRNGFGY